MELTVSTGSGNIHLTRGSGNQVHIFGRVKSNWGGSDQRVQQIAANPPIEQTGNIVRIGARHENLHNISIDYEIQAPADAFLNAGSGSGDMTDDGIGDNAKLSTGSGNIHATGLQGSFKVEHRLGQHLRRTNWRRRRESADWLRQHRAAQFTRRPARGHRIGRNQGGRITASEWKLETGSGSIEFWPGNTGFTLDASTGSGRVHTDREMLTQGSADRHHITGKINGGGPTVRIETGSGNIRIH